MFGPLYLTDSLLSSHPHMKPQAQGPQGLRRQRGELAWWRRVQGPQPKQAQAPALPLSTYLTLAASLSFSALSPHTLKGSNNNDYFFLKIF